MWSALIDNIRIRSLSIGLVVVEICPLSYFHHRTSCVKNKKKPILLWGVSLTPLYTKKTTKKKAKVIFAFVVFPPYTTKTTKERHQKKQK